MNRSDFLKTIGFGTAAITSGIMTSSAPLIREDAYPKAGRIGTEHIASGSIIELSNNFKDGDVIRWVDKNDEFQYGVCRNNQLYTLEKGINVSPKNIKKGTFERLSKLRGSNFEHKRIL